MKLGRDLLIGGMVLQTVRLLPMLLAFGISMSLLNSKRATVKPTEISYQAPGFIDFYMANEMLSFHCANIDISVEQSERDSRAYIDVKNCQFSLVAAENYIRNRSPWSQSLDNIHMLSDTDIYPYLKKNGLEFRDTGIVLEMITGKKQIEQHCVISEWNQITYPDSNKELGVKAFCPRLMQFTGLPIPLDTTPAYINSNNAYYSRRQQWYSTMLLVYAAFDYTVEYLNSHR